jgi:hypothetical protein
VAYCLQSTDTEYQPNCQQKIIQSLLAQTPASNEMLALRPAELDPLPSEDSRDALSRGFFLRSFNAATARAT